MLSNSFHSGECSTFLRWDCICLIVWSFLDIAVVGYVSLSGGFCSLVGGHGVESKKQTSGYKFAIFTAGLRVESDDNISS